MDNRILEELEVYSNSHANLIMSEHLTHEQRLKIALNYSRPLELLQEHYLRNGIENVDNDLTFFWIRNSRKMMEEEFKEEIKRQKEGGEW